MAYFEHTIWDTKFLMIYWSFGSFIGLFVLLSWFGIKDVITLPITILTILIIDILGNFAIWKLDNKNLKNRKND